MLRRLLALRAIAIGLIVAVAVTSTTTVGAASFAYDAQPIARVDARAMAAVKDNVAQLSVAGQVSASPSVDAGGASTTRFARSVATNGLGASEMRRLLRRHSVSRLVPGVRLRVRRLMMLPRV